MLVRIKTLKGYNSSIYKVENGMRFKLCNCDVSIDLLHDERKIKLLGGTGIKTKRAAITICSNCTDRDIENATEIDVVTDIPLKNGMRERVTMTQLRPIEPLDLDGDWEFELIDYDQVNHLFSL